MNKCNVRRTNVFKEIIYILTNSYGSAITAYN